jgi:Putative transposase/Transposase zinc-binding domain
VDLELADIFHHYGSAYRARYGDRLLPSHRRVMRAVEQCRTEALGGQVYTCGQCDQVQYRYHSCRNRHCPKCQQLQGQHWLEKQQEVLLPVPYFLLTFTLPADLRPLARQYQKLFYNCLFRASAAATQQLAHDPRFIGGQIGMVGVLHTWTRDLRFHPHVHYLVPAGGLADDGRTWLPARRNFFLPVKALSRLFRAHFQKVLLKVADAPTLPESVWALDWVVHCKPVGSGQTALKYLAPYIFRVALSNRRLVKMDNGQVTFRYTQAKTGQTKFCSLPAEQFIHRFLQHVLPRGFVKVRYYGLFGRRCGARLAALQATLRQPNPQPELPTETVPATPVVSGAPPKPRPCPKCGSPMRLAHTLSALARSPP